uniref:Ribonuclease A-domain domain-containing protein n=1 Tax=Podarcis muralis TaxID=64176 RepID=A0A670KHA9_PODMU
RVLCRILLLFLKVFYLKNDQPTVHTSTPPAFSNQPTNPHPTLTLTTLYIQHINYPKTSAPNLNAYCNLMMVQRKLNPAVCKFTNTFINNPTDSVQDVCGNGGKQFKDKLYDSNNPFSMTICRFINGKPPNDCKYKGTVTSRRIRVTCENKKPVHLAKLL